VTTPELHTDEPPERPYLATGAPPPAMVKMVVTEAYERFRFTTEGRDSQV
jgi:hypothetical protein